MDRRVDVGKKVDLTITIMIVFFFALGLTFSLFDFKSSYENYIMFLVLMIVCIISYYLGVTLSLVVTLVVDFTYVSVKIYQFFAVGKLANLETYYWLIMIVIAALISSFLSRNIVREQRELEQVKEMNEKLVMIDSETEIRNIKAFMNEVPIYMSMVKRHRELPITLMIVQIQYSKNLKRILGEEKYKELIKTIGVSTNTLLREEDRKYILNSEKFAYILITDKKGAEVVKNRIREKLEAIVLDEESLLGGIKIEVKMGSYQWDEEVKTPGEFLRKAEGELNYDV